MHEALIPARIVRIAGTASEKWQRSSCAPALAVD